MRNPSVGGASPRNNPQIPVANKLGAANQIPAFIQPNGPVRAVRFIKNPDGTPDNGVHDLFVITLPQRRVFRLPDDGGI